MLSSMKPRAAPHALVDAAIKAGADAADVLYIGDAVDRGAGPARRARGCDPLRRRGDRPALLRRPALGERLLLRSFARTALAALVERAAAMAREAPEDPYAGLAPDDRLLRGAAPDLEADDGAEVEPQSLRDRAQRAAGRRIPTDRTPRTGRECPPYQIRYVWSIPNISSPSTRR